MMQIAETVRRHLGWCPHASDAQHRFTAMTPGQPEIPIGGSAAPVFSYSSKNRYRNRALVFALGLTGVGFFLLATAQGDRLLLFGAGLVVATLLYTVDAVRYLYLFADILTTGPIEEMKWNKMRGILYLTTAGAAIVIIFSTMVLIGGIPGIGMLSFNAFLAGFTAIGWYHFLLIFTWERKNHRAIFSKGTFLYVGEEN